IWRTAQTIFQLWHLSRSGGSGLSDQNGVRAFQIRRLFVEEVRGIWGLNRRDVRGDAGNFLQPRTEFLVFFPEPSGFGFVIGRLRSGRLVLIFLFRHLGKTLEWDVGQDGSFRSRGSRLLTDLNPILTR